MSAPVTQWFEMQVEPIHEGVYQLRTKNNTELFYSLWRSSQWNLTTDRVEEAPDHANDKSWQAYNGFITGWRGLTKESK